MPAGNSGQTPPGDKHWLPRGATMRDLAPRLAAFHTAPCIFPVDRGGHHGLNRNRAGPRADREPSRCGNLWSNPARDRYSAPGGAEGPGEEVNPRFETILPEIGYDESFSNRAKAVRVGEIAAETSPRSMT